jgi:hypothetical protein
MRHKAINGVKEKISNKYDFEEKSHKINRMIEYEFKYFGERHRALK